MTNDVRREGNVALGYVSAIQGCLDHLDRLGVERMWTTSARVHLEAVSELLATGVNHAERDLADEPTDPPT